MARLPTNRLVDVDFKKEPAYIPSGHIKKLEKYAYSSGGIGDIWKCLMSAPGSNPRRVAVKAIRPTYADKEESLHKASRGIRREAYVWIELSHNNILPLLGVTDEFGKLPALVCPWMENGALSRYLEREFPKLTADRKLELVRQVADGLGYLHGRGVVHGDLTGTNILVDASGNLRLADFGLSMIAAESGNLTFGSLHMGNTRWIAPEFLNPPETEKTEKPTTAGDVYSFGCVMLQILSGEEPYCRLKNAWHVFTAIQRGSEPFSGTKIIMSEFHRLLSYQCLSREPEGRPSINEIIAALAPVVSSTQAQ